ncbi:MAG TPA: alkane 1-monooxygenase [Saprospiraceae bacterium]|nr:alkane 1-monooxygenase [Saprospiraceae bacterium]
MTLKDTKYLTAYAVPICFLVGIYAGGYWSYLTILFAFGFIPLVEELLAENKENYNEEELRERKKSPFFDALLYFNVLIIYGFVLLFLYELDKGEWTSTEYWGQLISLGIVMGAGGINVAHELGHRSNKKEQFMAKLLLLPSLYMHFIIEHNRGHHKNVATRKDPATARFNENFYQFWLRSVSHSYLHAWQLDLQYKRSKGMKSHEFWKLDMFWFNVAQILYLALAYFFFGWVGFLSVLIAGIISFSLLELINYIEHYGMERKLKNNGQYERVGLQHSWNSDKKLGRIVLYELTRHSDHHFRASKKYQLLESNEKSPNLPLGYPASMIMALLPPLWFAIMNPRVPGSAKHELAY